MLPGSGEARSLVGSLGEVKLTLLVKPLISDLLEEEEDDNGNNDEEQ